MNLTQSLTNRLTKTALKSSSGKNIVFKDESLVFAVNILTDTVKSFDTNLK